MRANAVRWKVCQNLNFEAMEELEILDKIEIALSYHTMAIGLILSDVVQYTKPQPEDIKANHEYVEELKKGSDAEISRMVAKIKNASTPEDATDYITEILTHCTLYSRLHNDDDLEYLKQMRPDYQNAPWYSLAMLEYQIAEYEEILETGGAIRNNKVSDIDIRQDIAYIFEIYWKLGCSIDAAALLKGVDFIRVQDKCGIWIYKEHDQIELIGRLGSAKRVRDLLAKAAGTGTEPQPEQPPFALPPELDTPQAREYLNRAQKAGFLDERYQPIKGFTSVQKKLFAAYCAVAGNITERHWKLFEDLWDIKGLQKVKEEQGSEAKAEAVAALFPPDIVEAAKKRFTLLI